MKSTHCLRVVLIASAFAFAGHLAVADTGSPPPPRIVIGGPLPPTKTQVAEFWNEVLPSYEEWLSTVPVPDTPNVFALFLATYPCSAGDRAAFMQLYLQCFPTVPLVDE